LARPAGDGFGFQGFSTGESLSSHVTLLGRQPEDEDRVRLRRQGDGGTRGLNAQVGQDQIDPLARRLNVGGRGQQDLIAFLQALDDPGFDRTILERVPSGLTVGGRLQQ